MGILAFPAAAATAPPESPPAIVPLDADGYDRAIRALEGRVVVVNMWATWCEPCREEFPILVAFEREMRDRGVTLFTVSIDAPSILEDRVIPFLKAAGAMFPGYIKSPGGDDAFINRVDPAWSGALPATFVYDRQGKLTRSIFGTTDRAQLDSIVAPLIGGAP